MKPARHIASSQKGFTLVETMVALAVFAIIASASTGMLGLALKTGDANKQSSDQMGQLAIAHSLMRDDFLQMVVRPTRDKFGSQLSTAFEGGFIRDRITVARLARRGRVNPGGTQRRGGILAVHYLFQDGRLIRRIWPQTDPTPDTEPFDQILFDGVKEVSTRFLRNGLWQPIFETDTRSSRALPTAVEVRISFDDGEDLRFMFQGTGERIS